ncbi:phosphoglycerate dehydrogenase [Roseburia sp. BX1005]|uniref:D-3-phosphoglycerate dehydrogenase n=1 Tax=Roseburia zhanii TaxID=2763064 RepID=A0A923LN68_9FIRM|nr:phosphoglycerate dehydrogenase [Roseburia zhanii]MBC5713382.1 phosphoglycerate dehydrogenase [Roseburia zhanii]
MFQYTCLNPIANVGLDLLSDDYKKVEDLKDAQAVLVRSASMHDLDLPDSLEAVARAGAGVNNIPLDKCADKGIVVFNTPGANANGVKEMVLAGLLLASRDIVGGIEWIKESKDEADIAKLAEKQKKNYAGCEISGKKLGVIGLGAIGVLVANAATHLGMEVYGYDPYISVNAAWNLSRNVKHISNVEEIYKECDYITVHVPLLDSTKGMIDKNAIDMMKDGVVILNFARDLLVDEAAVVAALADKKVKRYVTDFPNPTTAGKEGVILTPHLGASTEESEDNCAMMAVREIRDYLENGNIVHSVNYPDCSMGGCDKAGRVAVLHKNSKGMIAQYTSVLGDADINIEDMMNKSKGDYAYTLLDVDTPVTKEVAAKLEAIEGVLKVRVVK